jgi:transposase
MSPSTVSGYLSRAEHAGLTREQAKPLSDAEVEARLFSYVGRSEPATRAAIDFQVDSRRARPRRRHAAAAGSEYETAAKQRGAQPYQYSQFCELYAGWRDRRRLSMRQVHRPGEKLFLDYSGKKPRLCELSPPSQPTMARQRIRQTAIAASPISCELIFDCPARRSTKSIGTSVIRRPR